MWVDQVEEVDENFERELEILTGEQQKRKAVPPFGGPIDAKPSREEVGTMAFKVIMKKGGREDRTRSVEVSQWPVIGFWIEVSQPVRCLVVLQFTFGTYY